MLSVAQPAPDMTMLPNDFMVVEDLHMTLEVYSVG